MMLEAMMPSLKGLVSSDYGKIKTKESERLIEESLKGLYGANEPQLLQVSGIPGAGKSTFCARHLGKNVLFISFDKIMCSLAGYQRDLAFLGAKEAFKRHEMPARIIGYEMLRRALKLRLNIMLEHSGANAAHLELFENARKAGYKTAVDFIVCDTGLALKRAAAREALIKRHVPESLILERAEKMGHYLTAYQKLGCEVKFFDGANNFKALNKI